jgi:DNA-binding IclR family transcriptional regulator
VVALPMVLATSLSIITRNNVSRPALSATRAARVLSHLAVHPDGQWTIAELSRTLDVNLSSLHAVLATLETEGFVRRDPVSRSYSLGPSAVAVGIGALRSQQVISHAERELDALATELGLEGFVTAAGGDTIVVLARVGHHRPSSPGLRVAQRIPLVPPLGAVFSAWAADTERAAWLDRASADETERSRRGETLTVVRTRGYAVGLEVPEREQFGAAVAATPGRPASEAARTVGRALDDLSRTEYQLGEIVDGTTHRVSVLAAPVFDRHGYVELALTLAGFDAPLSAGELRALGSRLRDAGVVLTRSSGGSAPSQLAPADDRA